MTYLLDTDTCIYWLRDRYSVREKVRQIGWNEISICVITAAELYYGAYNSSRVIGSIGKLPTARLVKTQKPVVQELY